MTFTLIIRSIIIYTVVLMLIRIMGKRQIGEMQPFELVITLIIADLATIPMAETALPLIHGVIPLLTIVCVHYLLSFIARKSLQFRKFLNGKPIIVINPNGIDFEALKSLNMNFNDLMESLRGCNYFNIDEVLYAIVQTNGTLTVVPRAVYAPLTANDMKISKNESALPMIIISKGKYVKENLTIGKLDQNEIEKALYKANAGELKDILFATIDNNGKMYIQPYKKAFISFESGISGGEW